MLLLLLFFDQCLIPNCDSLGDRRGLCQKCYRKWQRGYIEHPIEKKFTPIRKKNKMKVVEKSLFHEKAEIDKIEQNLDTAIKQMEGKKETLDKPDYSCVPMETLEGVARVFEKGKLKYGGSRTWMPGIAFSKLCSAMVRHLVSWYYMKEDVDAESGESHLSHIVANCLMLLTFKDNKNFDDR